jgi:DNA sulfur modification protein DndC
MARTTKKKHKHMSEAEIESVRQQSRKKRRRIDPGPGAISYWEDQRLTFADALEMTAQTIDQYGSQYPHWTISFSGGKDSTTTLAVIWHLIETGRIAAPESITVLYSDTRMELPSLAIAAREVLATVAERGWQTRIVEPPLEDRFFVRMLGWGYPPPHTHLRYCTDMLKLKPMQAAVNETYRQLGQKFLALTGYRLGESAIRDQRIALVCNSKNGECGQGSIVASVQETAQRAGIVQYEESNQPRYMFTRSPTSHPMDVLCPILPWRVCHITDVLAFFAPAWGIPTQHVLETYGWTGNGDHDTLEGRTGCYCCPVAGNGDPVLRRLVKFDHWNHLEPLLQLREVYIELAKRKNRLTKTGERNADGRLSANFNRDGPILFEARYWGLSEIKRIQAEVNARAEAEGKPGLTIITEEEEQEIIRLIEAETYPEKWSGSDYKGTDLFDRMMGETEDGMEVWQPVLAGLQI